MHTLGFDSAVYKEINEKRWAYFASLISQLVEATGCKNVLEVGAGAGYFSGKLSSLGLKVTATDGRPENVAEIAHRFPKIDAVVVDIQVENALSQFNDAELIFCAGLLYHLENPVGALRSLGRSKAHVMLIETQVTPESGPLFRLVEEGQAETQGLSYLALVPSQTALVRLLHLFDWAYVYIPDGRPEHWQFQETAYRHQLRSVLVASKKPLSLSNLTLVESVKAGKGFQEKRRSLLRRVIAKFSSCR